MKRSLAPSHRSTQKKFVVPMKATSEPVQTKSLKETRALTVTPLSMTAGQQHPRNDEIPLFNTISKPMPFNRSSIPFKNTIVPKATASVTHPNLSSLTQAIHYTDGEKENKPSSTRYFTAVWGKRSSKKHKTWEGDGVAIVCGRSVKLFNLDGKEIGKANNSSTVNEEIGEDSFLYVGGKQVQITGVVSEEDYLRGRCFQQNSLPAAQQTDDVVKKAALKPFIKHTNTGSGVTVRTLQPRFNPEAEDALVLSRPPNTNSSEIVDIVVDPHISRFLRAHQRDGVNFLYKCIMGYSGPGFGAILADDMGLGKTLQIIALLWTILKQNPTSHKPIVKKALIITPSSLVKNWMAEFKKWLGTERLNVFAVSSDKKAAEFANSHIYPVMMVSYEMYIRYSETIKNCSFDIVVCDEGHRLKNSNIKANSLLSGISTRRRIVVTGTPIQNDLREFYTLADFCNPGCLGSASSFRKIYEEVILTSQQSDCSHCEKTLGAERAAELMKITNTFIIRRTNQINQQYLPEKHEYVVFCRGTSSQISQYKTYLQSINVTSLINNTGVDNSQALVWINNLKKLCNFPPLLDEREGGDGTTVEVDSSLSGKLLVTLNFIKNLINSNNDKLVLVSNYTSMLDVFQLICKSHNYSYLRLDGQTSVSKRLDLVNKFNSIHTNERIFLLSSKAGGVGLNLIGANHLILYDIDWNPANDLQAMARVWRDGQKKRVYIYRFITTGTIEEKIYQRQLNKQALGGSVMESFNHSQSVQFTQNSIKKLFKLEENTDCETHDLLNCTCTVKLTQPQENIPTNSDSEDLRELLKWKHVENTQLADSTQLQGTYLNNSVDQISFLFKSSTADGEIS